VFRIGDAFAVLAMLLVAGYATWAASSPATVEVKEFKFRPEAVTVTSRRSPGATATRSRT
jgi:hypothetical protein